MAKRISSYTTTCSEAAKILVDRHGQNALQIASNRLDAAQRMETAWFYEGVMWEIDRIADKQAEKQNG